MKIKLCVTFLLFFTGILLVPGIHAQESITLGLSPEASAHTRAGVAVGGGLLVGLDINQQLAAGLKAAYYHNLDTVMTVEAQAFFRYTLPWPEGPGGPFVQAELGSDLFFENSELFPAISGGLSLGWSFVFAENWFVEPAGRFGYPYIWGATLTAGYKFPLNKGSAK